MTVSRSTDEWELELGSQVRRARLRLDLSQERLARDADIAVTALRNLEAGRGSTLRTLVRTCRALGRTDWLTELEPEPEISPIALARAMEGTTGPRRATRRPKGT